MGFVHHAVAHAVGAQRWLELGREPRVVAELHEQRLSGKQTAQGLEMAAVRVRALEAPRKLREQAVVLLGALEWLERREEFVIEGGVA